MSGGVVVVNKQRLPAGAPAKAAGCCSSSSSACKPDMPWHPQQPPSALAHPSLPSPCPALPRLQALAGSLCAAR